MVRDREQEWDKLLKIKTTGRDDSHADQYKYPYEPTPYVVLERLANSGLIGKQDVLLDYGSGKGRAAYFLSWQTRCRSIGVEYDERIYNCAIENQKTAVSASRVRFEQQNAEHYMVPEDVSRCFFFNPFSVEILHKVLARIRESLYENQREIFLFFYYSSDEYIVHLVTRDEIYLYDEIDCRDLFENEDARERIMVFEYLV